MTGRDAMRRRASRAVPAGLVIRGVTWVAQSVLPAVFPAILLAVFWGGPTEPVQAAAAEPLYQFSPAPAWVNALTPDYDAPLPAGGVSDGSWDLLNDRQINVTADGHDTYSHHASRVVTASGVDSESQIDVSVDPTYQSLRLHSIHVVRQGRVIDHTQDARVIALPEETELRARIYDGGYHINILLPDVRVGDVVEYDYTLRSTERNFPGLFSVLLTTGWSIPVHQQRLRFLAPADLRLTQRASDGSEPRTSLHGGQQEAQWQWRDLAPITADADRPGWYTPWPYIEVSNARGWGEVARRVSPLFDIRPPQGAVAEVVAGIRGQGGTPAEQALRALQFVQDEIRYVSISIGRGAFQPASPATVLQRRFGDCKDKARLLATILRGLGIEAQPALVHSRRGHRLEAALPTPYAFDHAIVRMQLGEAVYWLDGTARKQLSPLSPAAPADFERALVLDPSTTGLSVIPRPEPGIRRKHSDVQVDLSAGAGHPGELRITTAYEGRLADTERQELADQSTAERQKSYLDYILRYYPGARTAGPITIHDDTAANVVAVTEVYQIDTPFGDAGRTHLFLQADEIYSYLEPLKSAARTSPLAVSYPVHVSQTIHVLLPRRQPIQPETLTVDNPAFHYQGQVSYSEAGRVPQLTLDYQYESHQSFVDVAALPRYEADRKRAYENTGYSLRPQAAAAADFTHSATAGAIAGPATLTALAAFLAGLYVALRHVLRWDPLPAPGAPGSPAGIRGWLLIPAAVVLIGPFADGVGLHTWLTYLDMAHWTRVPEAVPGPLRAWAHPILLAITAFTVLLLLGRALLMYLFFSRRTSAPYVFIVIHWMLALQASAVMTAAASVHLFEHADVGRLAIQVLVAMLRAAGFTAYLLCSRRVRATFVRRLPVRRRPAVDAAAPAA